MYHLFNNNNNIICIFSATGSFLNFDGEALVNKGVGKG